MKNLILKEILNNELKRQQGYIELIASENYVSEQILEATGSVFTNKYCEGYPNRRYYGGCEYADQIEQLAIDKAKEIFNAKFANVQPHSGTQANVAAYLSVLKPNDKILAMGLNEGGHLSHGSKVNISGKTYEADHYGVDKETQCLDYDAILKQAQEVKPKLIVCGASNYSRVVDFKKFGEIAKSVGAYLLADVAHISGLIVAGYHPNPLPYADIVTTTTHKTLRGPRSGLILTNNEELIKKINSAVFPGSQGGPLMHVIAAKYLCFDEASKPEFKTYIKNVIDNIAILSQTLKELGYKIIADGSDNHLLSVDLYSSKQITGDLVEQWLEQAKIVVNKNLIPYDINSAKSPSGIRIGSAAMTTRGFTTKEFKQIGLWIHEIIESKGNPNTINKIRNEVDLLVKKFPIYQDIKY
ncbi:serine hydroxymethyltransferase [Malacoplasma penetrans]|uniref:Serine hydroxymethyltransferase n=1 Tax=Malacoplasma penetrans (strain HF-2) TaxID=272633 RepID=GLYA_MALP2|nr:serine hydroxymethyltransferase [Malacoplasma penetrans]Q8EWD1.2 RecName: Full=Serine hydroxymethyltransferase; Short=SHMT; Short=Serine methylase [Malacoplasma penetrans HF-2]RXY96758.1 serine hydroxymethyltransferase [Malacoplasma penetrans]